MELMLWNVALSFISALILMWVKATVDEMKRIQILLNRTREEIDRLQILLNRTREEVAKEYVTKVDVHHDINRVLDRLDRLEGKLDTFIREQRSAIS